jgi:glyoxylase-like metal-dependent hydrolase (beta-lactamase superfamily II)
MLKPILPGIWSWSWYSDEKKMDFNGHYLVVGEHRVLVDPPAMSDEDKAQVRRDGRPDYIVLTNRDHTREAQALKTEFGAHLYVPEVDAKEMTGVQADKTYRDGELLPGGIWAVHLRDQKSPGECALFLEKSPGTLILGDALIGRTPGELSMLPADKYADAGKAREGLKRLLNYKFDVVLVGDGHSITKGAKAAVERVVNFGS